MVAVPFSTLRNSNACQTRIRFGELLITLRGRNSISGSSDRASLNHSATLARARNTHLIAIAVSWAEVIGATKVFIGAVSEDSSGYPDCRPEYYQAYNKLIEVGTKPETRVEIETPIIHMRKSQIVQLFNRARSLAAEIGIELHEGSTGGASDGCFTAALGIPTLDGLGPDGGGPHALHEHVLVESLAPRAALLTQLVLKL